MSTRKSQVMLVDDHPIVRERLGQLIAQQQLNKKVQTELEAQKSLAHTLSKQLQESLSGKERELIAQQQLSRKLQDEKRMITHHPLKP